MWCSYIVFQTECGNTIVTEKLQDGSVTWDENPSNLEERNTLASMVRSADCRHVSQDVRVGSVKKDLTDEFQKYYTQSAYSRVCGENQEAKPAKVPRKRRLDKYFDFKAQQKKQGKAARNPRAVAAAQ